MNNVSEEPEEKSKPKENRSRTQKKNFSFFDITTMIHPRTGEITADKHSSVSNGSALLASETAKEKPQKTQFAKDIKSFGLFHRHVKSSNTEQSSSKIYTVSEEIPEPEISSPTEKSLKSVKSQELTSELNVNKLDEQCLMTQGTKGTLECLPLEPSGSGHRLVEESQSDDVKHTLSKELRSDTRSTQEEPSTEGEDTITKL